MSVLAQVRPDSWNFPLLLHVGGAMILVAALPGFIVMRASAEWIADKEGFNAEGAPEPDWLGVGYIVSDLGALLLIIALIVGGIGSSRMRKGEGGQGLLRATLVISIVLLVAFTVAIWAMSAKPD